MFGRKTIILVSIWLITATAVDAQVQIQAQVLQRDLRVFFLSDLNLTGRSTSSHEIFSITISNSDASPQNCRLGVAISSANLGLLASGVTNTFTLPGGALIRITNQNLFSQAQQFSLQDYHIEDTGTELRDRVLRIGKLPSDIYRFTFQILRASNDEIFSDTFIEIDVSNPTSLDLIGPGAPADRGDPISVLSPLPIFRWTSNNNQFKLCIAEKLPDVHDTASPAEIIQDRVRFERIFTLDPSRGGGFAPDGSEYIATTAFPYPAAGAWPLEPGKTYFWQIVGLVPSSGSTLELPSEIWSFAVQGGTGTGVSLSDEVLLAELRALLGDRFESLFGADGGLDGFSATGMFTLNGRWISREQIKAILAKIASGEYTLIESRVE